MSGQERITAGQYRNLPAARKGQRRHKYGAKHVWLCAVCHFWHDKKPAECASCGSKKMDFFASRAEAKRALELLRMEAAGLIRHLKFQPEYPICINGVLIGKYRADFAFEHMEYLTQHVIDVKGIDTQLSAFKRKCVEALYGIKIEVEKL